MVKKFTVTHEWVEMLNGEALIGITQHAVKEIGEIVFVELPQIGKRVHAGQEVLVLESTKAAIDVTSPLTGEVVAINQTLLENIYDLNHSPEKEGWLFKLKIADLEEVKNLLDAPSY